MKTTLRRLLPILFASLLLVPSGHAQTQRGRHDETETSPIELNEITLEFAVQDNSGKVVWQQPAADAPNTIPAGALRLRFTVKVVNRPKGSTIRLRATLQEVCPSPDSDKAFLARLRHLTESDPSHQTTDPADDELQVVGPDGRVTIEIPVHCDTCVHATCGKQCPDRDHLGEGPHVTTLTASDGELGPRSPTKNRGAVAKPASFRMNVMSACPKEEPKAPTN